MLTARIMIDNTPRHGLETPIDPEQGPGETTGGFMDMILRRSPFATGVVMTRARLREHSGWTFPTINQPLGQPEEEAMIVDYKTSMSISPADMRAASERKYRPLGTGFKRSGDVTLDVPSPREDEPEEPEVIRGVESPTLVHPAREISRGLMRGMHSVDIVQRKLGVRDLQGYCH
jgi:hypothetical protein